MAQIVDSLGEKGNHAELKFKGWLDKHKLAYWYIQQDLTTFSNALALYFGSKRPDFMILLPNLGFILVDVKYKQMDKKFKTFPLDCEETRSYSNLQRHFNLQMWYVLSNEEYDYGTWFWIPVTKVLEIGRLANYTSRVSGKPFFPIPHSDFIQIPCDDSLDKLFAKCLKEKV
ncbi:hypothetical protein HZB01_00340 [Candidatus Woesearchaeota archaeon]|nr:hypothetical protein [Candidatus Woesearchaeota archaeon]